LSTSQTVTREWPLLWAEYHQGLYGVVTYTVTRLLLELTLLRVLPAVAFSGIFYPMMGLKREILPFMRFLLAAALASADSALLCATVAAFAPRQPGATSLVATVALLACILVSGFNINLSTLQLNTDGRYGWIGWLPEVSFGRHAFEIMLCTELEGQMVDVDVPGAPPVRIEAAIILQAMGLSPERYGAAFGALLLIAVVLIANTAVVLVWKMRPSFRVSRFVGNRGKGRGAQIPGTHPIATTRGSASLGQGRKSASTSISFAGDADLQRVDVHTPSEQIESARSEAAAGSPLVAKAVVSTDMASSPAAAGSPAVALAVVTTAPAAADSPAVARAVVTTAPAAADSPAVAPAVITNAPAAAGSPAAAPAVITTAPAAAGSPAVAPAVVNTDVGLSPVGEQRLLERIPREQDVSDGAPAGEECLLERPSPHSQRSTRL